jgi:hypothetical protein
MTQEHPITPPPELVQQWYDNMGPDPGPFESFANAAARWGADQELEACCRHISNWFATPEFRMTELRAARRPKSPSLKEQALKALDDISIASFEQDAANVIRRALEQLTD